jgi:TPR repeat protein
VVVTLLMYALFADGKPLPERSTSSAEIASATAPTGAAVSSDQQFVIAGMMEINDKKISSPQTSVQLRTTASNGVVESQLLLGKRFAVGDGVIRDDEEAIRWFKLASGTIIASLVRRAEAGDVEAMVELGRRCADGIRSPADGVVALDWLRKAALKGHVYSQYD